MRKPREADAELAAGASIPEVRRRRGDLPPLTRPPRRDEKADAMKRLKELEKENARLKEIVADQALDISTLKEVSRGNF